MRYACTAVWGLLLAVAAVAASGQPVSGNEADSSKTNNSQTVPDNSKPAPTPSATTRCPPGSAHPPESRVPAGATSDHAPLTGRMPAPGQTTRMPPCR